MILILFRKRIGDEKLVYGDESHLNDDYNETARRLTKSMKVKPDLLDEDKKPAMVLDFLYNGGVFVRVRMTDNPLEVNDRWLDEMYATGYERVTEGFFAEEVLESDHKAQKDHDKQIEERGPFGLPKNPNTRFARFPGT